MEKMYAALHYACPGVQRTRLLRQRRQNNSGMVGEIAFRRVYLARTYTTLVVLVVAQKTVTKHHRKIQNFGMKFIHIFLQITILFKRPI